MRKTLLLCLSLVVVVAIPAHAELLGWGLGACGGINVPIAQDDAGNGSVFGLRGQIQPISLIRFEPFVSFVNNGDYDIPGLGGPFSSDGGKLNAFGVSAMLGTPMSAPGFGIAAVVGLGSWKYDVDGYESETRVGYTGGLDISIHIPRAPVAISGRGELLVIPEDGGGSRKHALITIGAIYNFGL